MVERSLRPRAPSPGREEETMPMHTDPICRMQVDEKTAAGMSEYQGRRYYFCSPGCKDKFDRNPQSYAGAAR